MASTMAEVQVIGQLTEATKKSAVASIVAALITVSGRPHSVAEVQKLMRDVEFYLYPAPGNGAFIEWQKTFKAHEVHK